MFQAIRVQQEAGIATLWLDRPQVHNAFDEALIEELDGALAALEADAAMRVVVLAGAARNFCAGADLHWMQRAAAAGLEANRADARRFAAMLRRLATLRKPTLARVQGLAAGGGVGLAAACDLCVASEDAVFAMTEVRLGLIPAVIGPYVLRAIGPRQCLRYMQTAERMSAARAHALGLVHEVAASTRVDEVVAQLCAQLLAGGPQAQAAVKELVARLEPLGTGTAAGELAAEAIARTRGGAEAGEGIAAFFAKRAPDWSSGRS